METKNNENNNQQLNKLFYKGNSFFHSGKLNLERIFTKENIQKHFAEKDLADLTKYLPQDISIQVNSNIIFIQENPQEFILSLLDSKPKFVNAFENFQSMIDNNYFTLVRIFI